jgi:hypothetical protein
VINDEHKPKIHDRQLVSFLTAGRRLGQEWVEVGGMTAGRRLGQERVEVCSAFTPLLCIGKNFCTTCWGQ